MANALRKTFRHKNAVSTILAAIILLILILMFFSVWMVTVAKQVRLHNVQSQADELMYQRSLERIIVTEGMSTITFTNVGERAITLKYLVHRMAIGLNITEINVTLAPGESYIAERKGKTGVVSSLGNSWWGPSWHGAIWLLGWSYRKSHVINPVVGAGTNYQIKITCHYGSGTDNGEDVYLNGHCRTDFGDIRFTGDDGATLLDYWMGRKSDSNYATFWVEVKDDLSNNPAVIYVYYGNSSATTTSNGEDTFLFFDDMEEGEEKWTKTGLWHITQKKSYSPDHSFWYGQEDTNNYDTGARNFGELETDQLPSLSSAKLELRYWREVEWSFFGEYDKTSIYDSVDGSSWNQIWKKTSRSISERRWTSLSVSLSENARYLKFYFDTVDGAGNDYWGWFIDDVRVRKYVDPEPSHGSWGAEEAALQSPSSNFSYDFAGANNPEQFARMEPWITPADIKASSLTVDRWFMSLITEDLVFSHSLHEKTFLRLEVHYSFEVL